MRELKSPEKSLSSEKLTLCDAREIASSFFRHDVIARADVIKFKLSDLLIIAVDSVFLSLWTHNLQLCRQRP